MKIRDTIRINGEIWAVVDVAPALELAEMVAVILEDEGFNMIVKSGEVLSDPLSHLGVQSQLGTSYVLVRTNDTEKALELIAESVTDYEGEELEKIMTEMANEDNSKV